MSARIRTKGLPIQFQGGNQIGTPTEVDVDVDALARELNGRVNGEVRFDAGSRALYASDDMAQPEKFRPYDLPSLVWLRELKTSLAATCAPVGAR